jgi:hypothetical protein
MMLGSKLEWNSFYKTFMSYIYEYIHKLRLNWVTQMTLVRTLYHILLFCKKAYRVTKFSDKSNLTQTNLDPTESYNYH